MTPPKLSRVYHHQLPGFKEVAYIIGKNEKSKEDLLCSFSIPLILNISILPLTETLCTSSSHRRLYNTLKERDKPEKHNRSALSEQHHGQTTGLEPLWSMPDKHHWIRDTLHATQPFCQLM